MRIGAILACAALPAFAQFDLATTRDGSILYFSAPVPHTGNVDVYRWTRATGVTRFADRPDLADPNVGVRLTGTQLTAAGSVLYHAGPNCPIGREGNQCAVGQTVINIPGLVPFSEDGYLLISPNGRYGISTPWGPGAFWMDWETGATRVVDAAGVPDTTSPFHPNQHALSNDGKFLVLAPGGANVWSPGGTLIPLPFGGSILSADGSTVAGTYPCCVREGAFVYDLASGHTANFNPPIALSDDGQVAYFETPANTAPVEFARLLIARSDATGAQFIGFLPGAAQEVALSGDGRVVYVVATDPRNPTPGPFPIFRFEVATGAVDEIDFNPQ